MKTKGTIKKYYTDKGIVSVSIYSNSGEQSNLTFHINKLQNKNERDKIKEGVEVVFSIVKDRNGRQEVKDVQILKKPDKRYFLPSDTSNVIEPKNIDNFFLKLNKYARFFPDTKSGFGGSFIIFKKARKKGEESYWIEPDFRKIDINALNSRYENTITAAGLETMQLKFVPDWRIIVGLGQASVYETSIALHHIYGIPYIPASSIKGVLRSWVITTQFDRLEGNKKAGALADIGFCRIFGSPADSANENYQGEIHFFDAFPVKKPKVVPDIMNPHFGPYYAGDNKPPADYYSPVPVFFLAVEDTAFTVTCGISKKNNIPIESGVFAGKKPLDVVLQQLSDSLAVHGVGAKTAIGYGTGHEKNTRIKHYT